MIADGTGTLDNPAADAVPDEADQSARPIKRSFSIAGHRTSVSLEHAFWTALREIAEARDQSVAALVTEIDRDRGPAGLSSAVRVWILEYFRHKAREPSQRGPG